MKQKKFIKINDAFICDCCGHKNPPANKTCRNHCRECLCSKHVDINPGDRSETCLGILRPVKFDIKGAEITQIIFQCEKCQVQRKNKLAEDDNKAIIWKIMGTL